MTEQEREKLATTAAQTALLLLLKHVVARVYAHEDAGAFRRKIAALDAAVVDEINRTDFGGGDASAYARVIASSMVTSTLAAIVHPGDNPGLALGDG